MIKGLVHQKNVSYICMCAPKTAPKINEANGRIKRKIR